MKAEYLDQITAGYLRQIRKVIAIEAVVLKLFSSCHRNGQPTPPEYFTAMKERDTARKLHERWFRLFNSATKRLAQ